VTWVAGCNPDAIIHNEVQPLMLGEGIGFEGENRSPWSGAYTIVAESGGYCAYYSDETGEVDQARYDRALTNHPPGTEITVTATVQYLDAGAIAPSHTETLSTQVPLLLPVTDMRPYRRILGQQGGVVVPAASGTVNDGGAEDESVTGDEGGSGEGTPSNDAASPTGGSAEETGASADSTGEDRGDAGSGAAAASDLFEGLESSGWKKVGVAAFILLMFAFLVGATSLSFSTSGAVASAFVEVAEKTRLRKQPPPPPPPPPPPQD
jgi:hypothetical protein